MLDKNTEKPVTLQNLHFADNGESLDEGATLRAGEKIEFNGFIEIPLDLLVTAETPEEAVEALKKVKWTVDENGTTHVEGNYGFGMDGMLGLLSGLIKAVPALIERIETLESEVEKLKP